MDIGFEFSRIARSLSDIERSIGSISSIAAEMARDEKGKQRAPKVVLPREPTDAEADELILLGSLGGDLRKVCEDRATRHDGTTDEALVGMWMSLESMGYIDGVVTAWGDFIMEGVTPLGAAAAERRKAESAAEAAARDAQWRHDFKIAGFSGALGGLFGIVGTMLGVLLGSSF